MKVNPETIFAPYWPPELAPEDVCIALCDDKGRNGGTFVQVLTGNDGDMHVSMQDWEDIPEGKPSLLPSARFRTWAGGGRNLRTRQALIWLALAIKMDNAERGLDPRGNPMEEGQ